MKYSIFLVIIITIFVSCNNNKAEVNKVILPKDPEIIYKLANVETGGVADSVRLPAQLAAFNEVSIFPKVNGYVKNVLVDIGSKVSQGELLMVLEAPELSDAALQAKEKYTKAKVDVAIDKERYGRLLEASKTSGAISPLDLSTIKAKLDADNALCNAEKDNWQMQETQMEYLKVRAPFGGIITERNVSPGALVSASVKDKPMLELKQENHLRLQVDIPEDIATTLKNNDSISFYLPAMQGKKFTGFIKRDSKNINPTYRSQRMEIDVPNPDGKLTPGMFADVIVFSKGNPNALVVPKNAVVTSTERKYVLVVDGKKIKKVDVTTGNNSIQKVEIYGSLNLGDKVIAQANDEIKER